MTSVCAIVDGPHACRKISEVLSKLSYPHKVVSKGDDYVHHLANETYDLLILDLDILSLSEIEEIRQHLPGCPIGLILSPNNVESLIRYEDTFSDKTFHAFKPIKYEYIVNKLKSLPSSILKDNRTYEDYSDLFVGEHPAIISLVQRIYLIEKSKFPVDCILILGETGVGKEVYAKYIHHKLRKGKELFAVNCNALPTNLLEEELFGHEKGVFTSAHVERKGILEEYKDGTVFFDEFAELDMHLQSKFLRILEDRLIRRIGSNRFTKCNSLFIFATNLDIEEQIRSKKFRLDLFHRINRVTFRIPPLRERKQDIGSLASFLLCKANEKYKRNFQLDKSVIEFFESCIWKGNVREMKNLLENLVCFGRADDTSIHMDDLPTSFFRQQAKKAPDEQPGNVMPLADLNGKTLDDMTKDFHRAVIEKVMRESDNHKGLAAEKLGLSRFQLYRYLKLLNLNL
ncbi:MAG: sigma 54-interacting transcriptional regulator [Syntrophobacteraceae bacterium]